MDITWYFFCNLSFKDILFVGIQLDHQGNNYDGDISYGTKKLSPLWGAAQLMNADVLMLDEPTGHLDVDNIKWLEDWLESFPGSIICTSHFSPFLDKMCTHIIDFQDRQWPYD